MDRRVLCLLEGLAASSLAVPGIQDEEMPRGSSWLFALPRGSSAQGGPGRIGAQLRLGLAEGAKQLSPWALDALCLAPGTAQVFSLVPQQ